MKRVHYCFPGSWGDARWMHYGCIGRYRAEYLMLYRLFRVTRRDWQRVLPHRVYIQFVDRDEGGVEL